MHTIITQSKTNKYSNNVFSCSGSFNIMDY